MRCPKCGIDGFVVVDLKAREIRCHDDRCRGLIDVWDWLAAFMRPVERHCPTCCLPVPRCHDGTIAPPTPAP